MPAIGAVLLIPKDVIDLSKKYLPEPIFKSVVASVIAVTFAATEFVFEIKFVPTRITLS